MWSIVVPLCVLQNPPFSYKFICPKFCGNKSIFICFVISVFTQIHLSGSVLHLYSSLWYRFNLVADRHFTSKILKAELCLDLEKLEIPMPIQHFVAGADLGPEGGRGSGSSLVGVPCNVNASAFLFSLKILTAIALCSSIRTVLWKPRMSWWIYNNLRNWIDYFFPGRNSLFLQFLIKNENDLINSHWSFCFVVR